MSPSATGSVAAAAAAGDARLLALQPFKPLCDLCVAVYLHTTVVLYDSCTVVVYDSCTVVLAGPSLWPCAVVSLVFSAVGPNRDSC